MQSHTCTKTNRHLVKKANLYKHQKYYQGMHTLLRRLAAMVRSRNYLPLAWCRIDLWSTWCRIDLRYRWPTFGLMLSYFTCRDIPTLFQNFGFVQFGYTVQWHSLRWDGKCDPVPFLMKRACSRSRSYPHRPVWPLHTLPQSNGISYTTPSMQFTKGLACFLSHVLGRFFFGIGSRIACQVRQWKHYRDLIPRGALFRLDYVRPGARKV